MLDIMKKDVLNVITQGTVDGGAAKKGKKSKASKKHDKSKKSKSKASKSVKRKVVKQPIGYVWKMSNVNGKITRELHPIYSTANANKEMKMMEKRMNKMLKDIKL
jgi:hypothetical protein